MFIGPKTLAYINLCKWSLLFIRGRFADNCVVFLRDFVRSHWLAYSAIRTIVPVVYVQALAWPGIVEPSRVAGRRGLSGFREGMWLDNISFILEARNQSQSRHSAPQFFICVLHLSFGAIVGRSPLASTRPPTLVECDEPRGQAAATCRHCCGTESTRNIQPFYLPHNMLHFACNKYESIDFSLCKHGFHTFFLRL